MCGATWGAVVVVVVVVVVVSCGGGGGATVRPDMRATTWCRLWFKDTDLRRLPTTRCSLRAHRFPPQPTGEEPETPSPWALSQQAPGGSTTQGFPQHVSSGGSVLPRVWSPSSPSHASIPVLPVRQSTTPRRRDHPPADLPFGPITRQPRSSTASSLHNDSVVTFRARRRPRNEDPNSHPDHLEPTETTQADPSQPRAPAPSPSLSTHHHHHDQFNTIRCARPFSPSPPPSPSSFHTSTIT